MEYSCFQLQPVQNSRRTSSERIRYIRENSFGGGQPHDAGVTDEQPVQNLINAHAV